jgi:uncharacterized membrane protein YvbJ
MARICPGCGRANDDDATFCQGCGAAVAEAATQAPQAPSAPPSRGGHTPGWVAVLVAAVIIALAAVAALLILPRGETTGSDGS